MRHEVVRVLRRVCSEFGLTGRLTRTGHHAAWCVELPDGRQLTYPLPGRLSGRDRAINNTEAGLRREIRKRITRC